MSPSIQTRSSFTRGEKCLFVHVVVTFTLVLALVVVYFCHLCLVHHHAGDLFRITRRKASEPFKEPWREVGVGVVLVGARAACGCVVLRPRWSASPARCVAAWSHPSLARMLPTWTIRYLHTEGYHQETGIIKGVVHTHFNKDNSENDIGLFQHIHSINMEPYRFAEVGLDDEFLYRHAGTLAVVELRGDTGGTDMWRTRASPVARATCRHHTAPITELRHYELCVTITIEYTPAKPLPDIGAALVVGTRVIGFFSWGDKHGGLPMVILTLAPFSEWIENIVNE